MDSGAKVSTLEEIVFGGEETFLRKLTTPQEEEEDESGSEPEELANPTTSGLQAIESSGKSARKQAWVDEDDEQSVFVKKPRLKGLRKDTGDDGNIIDGKSYQQKLRDSFQKISQSKALKWAELTDEHARKSGDSDEDEEVELARTAGRYIAEPLRLPKGPINVKRITDLNFGHRHGVSSSINSVEFHKSAQLALVAGESQRLHILSVDSGKDNEALQSFAFDRFPIETAHFTGDGERIVLTSRLQGYFYYYDLLSGKVVQVPKIKALGRDVRPMPKFVVSPDGSALAFQGSYGTIHLISPKSFELIDSLKGSGDVLALAFSSTGAHLYSSGTEGMVYQWNMHSRQCSHKFYDHGCIKGTSLAVSPSDNIIACGSNVGVVNVYEVPAVLKSSSPQPLHTFMNLTTGINKVAFNRSSEILAFSSFLKKDSMRLAHMTSMSVFTGFPMRRERLKKVSAFDFSPNSGFLAVGNDAGEAQLYKYNPSDS